MKKFDRRIKAGTKVLIGYWGWCVVEEVHETRNWVKIVGLVGSFQRSDIIRFTNKIRGFGRVIKLVIDKKENKDE